MIFEKLWPEGKGVRHIVLTWNNKHQVSLSLLEMPISNSSSSHCNTSVYETSDPQTLAGMGIM